MLDNPLQQICISNPLMNLHHYGKLIKVAGQQNGVFPVFSETVVANDHKYTHDDI